MRQFLIERSDADIVSNSGLALVGLALNKHSGIGKAVDQQVPLRHGIAHSDVLQSYIGLLSIGKSDCDAIENVRADDFFANALNISYVPSAPTWRQRLDKYAVEFLPFVEQASVDFLRSVEATLTPLPMGHASIGCRCHTHG